MPVCRAGMNEVLRTHVVSFGVVRRTGAAIELEAGKSVPADTDVMLLLHALHHDPEFWGDDADEFNPSRWGVTDVEGGAAPAARAPPKHAFAPFLDGSRQCAGKALAELEWTIAMHAMLSRYDLVVAPQDAEHDTLPIKDAMFTLTEGPVACTFVPRATTTTATTTAR
uniref:Cytochrome P450 n=1 Tax=Bicosoecida sp. CB-2014 TaxID=1486930 RepID=A0A7S1GCZ4_9STRA